MRRNGNVNEYTACLFIPQHTVPSMRHTLWEGARSTGVHRAPKTVALEVGLGGGGGSDHGGCHATAGARAAKVSQNEFNCRREGARNGEAGYESH